MYMSSNPNNALTPHCPLYKNMFSTVSIFSTMLPKGSYEYRLIASPRLFVILATDLKDCSGDSKRKIRKEAAIYKSIRGNSNKVYAF